MPKPYTPNDKWSRKAAEEGYRARSVYKLKELDERCKLLRPGMFVLDLGACPGSWLQYAAEKVGNHGRVIGVDLQEIEPLGDTVAVHQADITDLAAVESILEQEHIAAVDLVLSDLAPKTSGIKDVDQWRSIELSQAVVATAQHCLKPGGTCVMKVLRGEDFDEFFAECKENWKKARVVQVKASRDRSREVYVILKS